MGTEDPDGYIQALIDGFPDEVREAALAVATTSGFSTLDAKFALADAVVRASKDIVTRDQRGPRARCPLCGSLGNDQVGQPKGYLLPEGMLRHATGQRNARLCETIATLVRLSEPRSRRKR